MILIPVDPGHAFDFISILMVKHKVHLATGPALKDAETFIRLQLGSDKYATILTSDEFSRLLAANEEVFNIEERARIEETDHSHIREANLKRFKCKVALQRKYFSDQTVTERKTMA